MATSSEAPRLDTVLCHSACLALGTLGTHSFFLFFSLSDHHYVRREYVKRERHHGAALVCTLLL